MKKLKEELVEIEEVMQRKQLKQLLTSWVTLLGGQSSTSHFL